MRDVFAYAQQLGFEEPRGLVSDAARRRLTTALRKLRGASEPLYGLLKAPTLIESADEMVDPLVIWKRQDRFFRDEKVDHTGKFDIKLRQAQTFVKVSVDAGSNGTSALTDVGTVFEKYRPNGRANCYVVERKIMPVKSMGSVVLNDVNRDEPTLTYCNTGFERNLADFDLSEGGLGEGLKPALPMRATCELIIAAADNIRL